MTDKKFPDPHSSPFIPHDPSESAYEPEDTEDESQLGSYSRLNPLIPDYLLKRIRTKPPQRRD